MEYHVVAVAEKTLRRNCGNPLQVDMPCLRQSQVPALFAGVKSSWIRGFAVPTCPGLRRFANYSRIFASLYLLAHAQIQRSKMLFTPSKRIMQGEPLAEKPILKKHSDEIFVQIFCKNILNLETFANSQISFLEVQIVPAPGERFADFLAR